MKNLRYSPERNKIRAESLKESQKRGVFVDEFGCENPHLGMGTCRLAITKKNKMKCRACGKESKNELCPVCEIGQFEHDATVALEQLIERYHKLLNLESEAKNAKLED